MTTKPRLVLDQLIAAFENHYEVASSDQVDEQALIDAEEALRDAFFSSKLSFLSTSSFRMRKTRNKTLTTTMKMMKKPMMMTMNLSILMRMKTKTSRSSGL